jgi:hypothetical protein
MSFTFTQPGRPSFSLWRFGLLLALLVVAAFPQVIFGAATFVARDFGFFAYPLAHFQKECFWHGELPFWDPYNNCGVPFLAQWNTMPLYPPALLFLALPLAWALSCFSLLHLWFGGLGMFLLARRWTGSATAAAFAGTVFAFNGFTTNLLMWPSHIATFSWMPWVVFAVEAAWRDGGKKILLAAFVGGLQMLAGGPETIFLTWVVSSVFWLQQLAQGRVGRVAMLWRYPLVVVLVVSLTAVQLLPFLDLVVHAQRETGYTDLRWSMPRSGFAGFLVPMAFGTRAAGGIFFQAGQSWTSSYYLGIGTVWLGLLALFGPLRYRLGGKPGVGSEARARRIWLLAGLSLVGLLCALGENTPFYPLVRKLVPQLSLITYPIKFVMVPIFAAPLLAAYALAALSKPPVNPVLPAMTVGTNAPVGTAPEGDRQRVLVIGLGLVGLLGAIMAWTQAASMPYVDPHLALVSGITRLGFLVLTGVVLLRLVERTESALAPYLPLALIVIVWLDVYTHEPGQNPVVPATVYRENLARDHQAVVPAPELGQSRAMLSPTAALELMRFALGNAQDNFLAKRMGYCANVNLLDGVPKVDGFFSLTPREFDGLLSVIYSVTNANWLPLESFLGVSQYSTPTNVLVWQPRAGALPLVTAGQKPVFLDDTNAIWEMARGHFDGATMVFLPPSARAQVTATNPTPAKVTDPKISNQSVDFGVEAQAPAMAVIAQTYYHNWRVEIDGRPTTLLRANGAFQAVQVPAGGHRVHMYYEDGAFEVGAAVSGCMWLNCLTLWLVWQRRDWALAARRSA